MRFADFWLADQMTSLAVVWLDFSYFACFFTLDVKYWPGLSFAEGERTVNWTTGSGKLSIWRQFFTSSPSIKIYSVYRILRTRRLSSKPLRHRIPDHTVAVLDPICAMYQKMLRYETGISSPRERRQVRNRLRRHRDGDRCKKRPDHHQSRITSGCTFYRHRISTGLGHSHGLGSVGPELARNQSASARAIAL